MTPLSDIEKLELLLVDLTGLQFDKCAFTLSLERQVREKYVTLLQNLAPSLIADWKQMRGDIERLERLVYVPGLWSCPKCKLKLVSNTMHAGTGLMSANNDPQQCANGCGPMWRVTERDAGNDLCDRAKIAAGEIERLTRELDEAYELVAQKVDGLSEYTKYSKDFIADLIRNLKAKEPKP